ncbi:restriction endonuclease subunit S [Diaphorobacter nitroreducens]|uniref:restriction endonuclease subunit S n=2 Tax=Diaphorobacter TaxID=238749 RepID=UPI0011E4D615|nr:restriction endonuclease subunit S [Diaphorobacter nitroreducens]
MLLSNMELLATAPGGVAKLRELILTLAVQGKLVPQDPADEPAGVLLQKIRAEKDRLIAEGKIKRDKPVAGIAEEEKPFELPQGWEWVRCDDYFLELCTGPFGSMIHQEDYVHDGVPLINPSHMIGGRIIHDPRVTIKVADAERLSAYALSAGDMVLARRGEVGRYAYVTEQEHGWLCGTGSFFVRLYSQCNREYLGLIFSDVRFRQHLQGESVGTTMTNLNQRILLSALLALPPLAEQSRIVTRVEALMRLCDALEAKGQLEAAQHAQLVSTLLGTLTASTTPDELAANWQRVAQHFDLLLDRPEAIDALEQTLLQLAVRGLLVPQDPTDEPASALLQKIRAEKDRLIATGQIKRDKPLPPITDEEKPFELPVGWECVRMGALIELVSGQHLGPSEYVDGLTASLPYLTGPAEFGALSPDPTRSTHERRAVAICDDILITVKGSGVGKLNVVKHDEMAISRQLMAIRPILLNPEFLMIFLQTMSLYFQAKSIGIAIPGIGREDVTHAEFGLPPLPEQSRIVTRVTALRRLCADLRQRLAERQSVQARLAEALVQEVA